MKLAPRDVASFLEQPDARNLGALLYGPDSGLIRERSRRIATRVLGPQSDPLNLLALNADQLRADPARLRDELSALSLLGGKRVITVSGATDKLAPVVMAALEGSAGDAYLLLEADDLRPTSVLRLLFEKEPRLAALPCYRDEGRSLEQAIRALLAERGLRASAEALYHLAAHLGNDRGVTQNEIEKLALYAGAGSEVTLAQASAAIGHNAAEGLEDLCHAAAAGNAAEAQSLLVRLLHEGESVVGILRSLLKHFQRLDVARAQVTAGAEPDQIIAAMRPRVFYKYAPLFKRELALWRPASIAAALNLMLRTEKDLKSSLASPALLAAHAVQQIARLAA